MHSWVDKFISKPPHYNPTNSEATLIFFSQFFCLFFFFNLHNFYSVLVSVVIAKVGILISTISILLI